MPTYQYRCTECAHALEVQQSFTDDSLTVCPECEGQLRKVFNAVGVVFKGSGFYRNDSRSATSTDASADSGSSSSSGSEKSTDSPSAAPAKESTTSSPAKESAGSSSSTGQGSGSAA